jgi:hypothetical protein
VRGGVLKLRIVFVLAGFLVASSVSPVAGAQDQASAPHDHGSMAEVGKQLANPLSPVWALFTEFDASWSDGDLNDGDMLIPVIAPLIKKPLF